MTAPPIPVAFFSNAQARGGAEEHMLTLLRGFDRKRFRLFLVCPGEVAELLAGDLPPDVTLLRLTLRSPRQVHEMVRLGAFLRRQRIAVLHSHLFYASLFASPVARVCGVPVIVETPHINEFWRRGWKARYFVDRMVGRCVDRYIAVSHANARYLTGVKGLPANKVEVVQNGCDLRRFAGMPSVGPARQALGFAPQDQVLLIVGRLEPQKGHAVMLQALAALHREFPRVRLACVGEGALRAQLEEQARALGCQDIVRFAGYQRNIAEWLSAADVVVLPSLFEGLPLVAIEALAAGRPMVATAVDGTPEVVIDGQTGLTAPPGDSRALAEAIAALLRDPARAASLAAAGHSWVWERFSEQRQVRETEELYLRAWEERIGAFTSVPRLPSPVSRPAPAPPIPAGDGERGTENAQSAVRGLVCEAVSRVCRQEWADRLRALLLTGSIARDEATILAASGGWRVLGDADFLAVFQPQAPLPADGAVAAVTARCESALRAAGVIVHVSLAVVHEDYFSRLPAHIFTCELRCRGRMVCGEDNPLELIPNFSASAIDTEDAWRLLANRTIEFLELAESFPAGGPNDKAGREPIGNLAAAPEELHYRTVKLFLDIATSLLVFLGAYEPTYAQRAERLQELADEREEPGLPFPLKAFAVRVSQCTRWKINGSAADVASGSDLYREALDYACRLWRWELVQLTATAPEASLESLFAEVAARQSAGQRLRGWLYVARRTGWLRGTRSWPRWLAMSFRCSPRYYIYEAALRLAANEGSTRQIRTLLPVAGTDDLASALAWNYRTFLTETRA
jgi:glycosyltransferase involved in cell wall biosynthesis